MRFFLIISILLSFFILSCVNEKTYIVFKKYSLTTCDEKTKEIKIVGFIWGYEKNDLPNSPVKSFTFEEQEYFNIEINDTIVVINNKLYKVIKKNEKEE